jgi:hypothetical protein
MRKFLFATGLFGFTLVGFVFALIFSLALYRYHSSDEYFLVKDRTVAYAALPTNQNIFAVEIEQGDGRAEKLRQFFVKYHSPLEPYAEDVVTAADEYGLDFRLIPSIAMQESGLCKTIPYESYNCWGFGIYGKTVTHFKDYKEGIYTVTKALATRYRGRGLITPDQIMTMYTPSSNGSWARGVNHFMGELE